MDSELNQLAREVMNLKSATTVEPKVERKVNAMQNDIQKDLDRFRERGAFKQFLLQNIDEAYHNYRDPNHGRETPLCDCPSPSCDLKDGKIPSRLNLADSLSRAMLEFRQEHRGQPIILDESYDSWREKRRVVKAKLRDIIFMLKHNRIPERLQEPEGGEATSDVDDEDEEEAAA